MKGYLHNAEGIYYFVAFDVKTPKHNILATIYELYYIHMSDDDLILDKELDVDESFIGEILVSVDIWNKYYFPIFPTVNQWYHDGVTTLSSVFGIMDYALKKGLEIGEIEVY